MAMIIADNLKVCVDCTGLIANGETGTGDETDARVVAGQVRLWGSDAAGLVITCGGEDETGCDTFSTGWCDGCGDYQAGERHTAAVLR